MATRLVIVGLVPLSVAIILATQLVVSEVAPGRWLSWSISGILAVLILILWWIVPMRRHGRLNGDHATDR